MEESLKMGVEHVAVDTWALDGSAISGFWFTTTAEFAERTSWLNAVMMMYTSFGLTLFIAFTIAGWWIARRRGPSAMTIVLAIPLAAVLAYAVNNIIKMLVAEPRPCYAYPDVFLLEDCAPATDFAFPSNHTVVAAAMTAALFVFGRRWGIVALVATALMGFSRVYAGAHYPHDVLAGAVVGAMVGILTALVLRRYAPPLFERLSTGVLRPVLTTSGPAGGRLDRESPPVGERAVVSEARKGGERE